MSFVRPVRFLDPVREFPARRGPCGAASPGRVRAALIADSAWNPLLSHKRRGGGRSSSSSRRKINLQDKCRANQCHGIREDMPVEIRSRRRVADPNGAAARRPEDVQSDRAFLQPRFSCPHVRAHSVAVSGACALCLSLCLCQRLS